ncbi:thioredoxin domain-containing protein [Novosphingobium sp. Leaf2]|uniref:thioredoxin domain-containing protein n=1 Tax=Novosphingobium sp. Leaf2 TaxID=1735670 RepID=UPI0006F8E8CD|nr:thioredoxin domain-containing protein [Novosphingobium sp. Leaf2]KQM22158.1 protein-disulfide isomerase [Novosphingobium sp. Leaf2]
MRIHARMKTALRITALAACAVASIAAAPKHAPAARGVNWIGVTAVTANGGHRLGNPDAPLKLVEYVSYTCPHCAHFTKESEPVLRMTLIPKGQISVTVVNLLRNPIDMTVAMLTNCGDPKRFFVRNNAFFASQDQWLGTAVKFSAEQQKRWYQGEPPQRMRAMAADLGLYDKMATWGITRAQADACLGDKAILAKLKAQQTEVQSLGLTSTPSFTLNGEVLDGHDWESVSKAITDKMAEQREGST